MKEPMSVDRGERIVVVSDLHIGAGEIDDFRPELECHLVAFLLDHLGADPQPLELVINGDCFDFVTAAPWDDPQLESRSAERVPLCFTQEQSCAKLKRIVEAHGRAFDALARFLATGAHRLTILPGNHDADLFWPHVRRDLLAALQERSAAVERVKFVLERAYVIEREGVRHWIEHGHQHDPANSFFVGRKERWSEAAPPILKDAMGHSRLLECPGTLGLVRYINGWRRKYPSIGYIKPNSRILMALASHRGFKEPGRPLLVAWQLAQLLGWDVDWHTALSEESDIHRSCQALLSEMVDNLGEDEEAAFNRFLAEHGVKLHSTLKTSLEMPANCSRILNGVAASLGGPPSGQAMQVDDDSLGLALGSLKDVENQALIAMARRLVQAGKAHHVITGHTHAPVTALDGRFINGGCWVPNHEVDSVGAAKRVIFRHGSVPYCLSYVDVPVGAAPRCETFAQGMVQV
jgi:metallophosphoesterase superfamily enzyme